MTIVHRQIYIDNANGHALECDTPLGSILGDGDLFARMDVPIGKRVLPSVRVPMGRDIQDAFDRWDELIKMNLHAAVEGEIRRRETLQAAQDVRAAGGPN